MALIWFCSSIRITNPKVESRLMQFSPKLKNSWPAKTLEELENQTWKYPEFDSYLLRTCYELRKKSLQQFTVEDIRILVGQNIGLKYLVPIAISVLQENILAEGDFYEGDLLKSSLTIQEEYWQDDYQNWKQLNELFLRNTEMLESCETSKNIRKGWFDSYREFSQIHE